MNPLSLALRQVPYEQRSYWRNPAAAFFTFAFPIMFLVIFASLNTGSTINFLGGLNYNQFFIPGIVAFGVMSACYTNLAITLAIRRDAGILKRLRGTPLPASSMFGGLLGNSAIISLILVVLTTAIGILFYDVTFPGHWLALALALFVGALSFSALGIAVSTLIPNADAAPAVVNGVFFPALLLSGVFFPISPDSVLSQIADFFPVRHFVDAVFAAFDPRLPHGLAYGFSWTDLGVLSLWGVGTAVIAIRRFRWGPQRG